jgi:hypothetical protein
VKTAVRLGAPANRPAPMSRINVRGDRLYAGDDAWRAWGMNWGLGDHSPVLAYLDMPTPAGLALLAAELQIARRLGANSMRIPVELGEVMRTPTSARQGALVALQRLLAVAERNRVYLDIAGNLVWRPDLAPPWYERLSETSRWRVQANFWSAVAHALAGSPAVLCYELTSEPVISALPDHYAGYIGDWSFVQNIATTGEQDAGAAARAWTQRLAAAVRSHDDRPVTIGLLPSMHDGFAPANVADLLDMLTLHEYPLTGKAAASVAVVRNFAAFEKPVLLGETFPLRADLATERAFLLGARPYLVGAFEFFNGRDPNHMKVSSINDALYQGGLRQFISLRPELLTAQ